MSVVHAVRGDGGEYPAESEYILCDPQERYADPRGSHRDSEVTCKRCLAIINAKPKPTPKED